MRRVHFAQGILLVLLAIQIFAGRSQQQPEGFLSINCGGNEFTDADTNITWSRDGSYLDSATQMYRSGAAIPVTVNLTKEGKSRLVDGVQDNTEALKTAMMFVPSAAPYSKYCYSLPVEENRLYLLRVMFPPGPQYFQQTVPTEYSIGDKSTFNFSVDTTVIIMNTLGSSAKETEVVVTVRQSPLHVCLVPDNDSIVAISSIEIRPLAEGMYRQGREQGFGSETKTAYQLPNSYLRTVDRFNFGGDMSKRSLRFPLDPYDRFWVPKNPLGSQNQSTHKTSFRNHHPNFNYPLAIVQTAVESDIISFERFPGPSSPFSSLYFSLCFLDVNPGNITDIREVTITVTMYGGAPIKSYLWELQNYIYENTTWVWWNFAVPTPHGFESLLFNIERTRNSSLPALINAFEAYAVIQPGPDRTDVNMSRVARSVLHSFSQVIETDNNGDPCLPVQWRTMSCVEEFFFTLNLSHKAIDATLPSEYDRNILNISLQSFLTIDLSSNKFHGAIPQALLQLPFTKIILDNNLLSGFNFTSPWEIAGLNSWSISLSLDNNFIELPDFVDLLNNLTSYRGYLWLSLQNNKLSGPVPHEIRNVSNLSHLDLSHNKLTGRLRLEIFSGLSIRNEVILSDNKFTEIIPGPVGEVHKSNLSFLDLSYNQITGSFPHELSGLPRLQFLSLHHNFLAGEIPAAFWHKTTVNSLLLNHNFLTGEIPATFWNNSPMERLELQNNAFSGMIPAELWKKSPFFSINRLREVNLGFNVLTGVNLTSWCASLQRSDDEYLADYRFNVTLIENNISNTIIPSNCEGLFDSLEDQPPRAQLYDFVLLGGNPWCADLTKTNRTLLQRYLCRLNETDDFRTPDEVLVGRQDAPKVGSTRFDRRLVIGIGVGGSFFILLMGCALLLQFWKLYRRTKDLKAIAEALAKEDVRPPFYKYEDLKTATGNFSPNNALGTGAFGAVYKAVQADGSIVAVKLLYPSEQNIVDFLKEMVVISGIKHRNLVQLKGCCVRDNRRFLIYEFADNKSLADALWGYESEGSKLAWCQRMNICICVARGLAYLHEELHPKIIHRDIKPQNILLDSNWNAKIADFGLARPMHEDKTQLATTIGGTLGYFSPEYATFGFLSEKLDVYSFGIVALEIVSGRRCIDFSVAEDQVYLRQLAFKMNKEGRLGDLADQVVVETGSMDEILTVLEIALACLHEDPAKRPAMSQVVTAFIRKSAADLALDIVDELRHHDGQGDHLQAAFSSITFSTASSEESALLTSENDHQHE